MSPLNCAPYPSVIDALNTCSPYPSFIRACTLLLSLTSALRAIFVLCCVVSIVSYGLKLKNPRKATSPKFIPLKVIKFASNIIGSQLYNIIKDLEKNKYLVQPKTALVRPIFKKNDRNKKRNYRPVSILNGMSKIYERCIHISLSSYPETIL